jgi:DNA-directed RNA polymerase specialized sigma24 family protein
MAGRPARPAAPLTAEQAELAERARDLAQQIDQLQQQLLERAGERVDAIAALHDSGLSIRRIAAELGTSGGPVQSALQRRRPAPDPADTPAGAAGARS